MLIQIDPRNGALYGVRIPNPENFMKNSHPFPTYESAKNIQKLHLFRIKGICSLKIWDILGLSRPLLS